MTTVTPPDASPVPTTREEAPVIAGRDPGVTTAVGVGLQAAWLGFVAYTYWLIASGPEHSGSPASWQVALFQAFLMSVLAVTAGLVGRRRWALWGSTALALPMVALAVMCFQAGAGNHWIAEAGFAGAIVAGSVHPASWRMHTR